MAVFKKNGNWWIDCYLNGRRVRRKIGPDKRTAVLAEQNLKVRAAKGEWLGATVKSKRITFADFFKTLFEPRQSKNAQSTRAVYELVFRNHLCPAFGRHFLDQIQSGDIEDFIANRLVSVKPSTVNKERANLRTILNAAVRWGYLRDNPMKHVKPVGSRNGSSTF